MKREYKKPSLVRHGNVEELTHATGDPSQEDTFTAGGFVINGPTGSEDVTV